MKILLATHNFLPYYSGGTEIYVLHLAKFLIKNGHQITIIAAIGNTDIHSEQIIYKDDYLKIFSYLFDDLEVFGVTYNHISTEQIYSKKSDLHKKSFISFLNESKFDLLHINGFTATIGIDLIYALKEVSPSIKIVSSFHTAISDPKETLTFANTLREQHSNVNPIADVLCYRYHVPYWLGIVLSKLFPNLYFSFLPSIFSIKYLIKQSIKSFNQLVLQTDEWWVYSNGIKDHLISIGINPKEIIFQRHGILPLFIGGKNNAIKPTKYLFSGRALKIKGFHTLINAWLSLPDTDDKQLWITGDPIATDGVIAALIEKSQLRQDIRWLGILKQDQLAKVTLQVDTVIIPSECYEIGPLVFHEAIASGCNVIASDIGGCKELGIFYAPQTVNFKAGDVVDLSKKITSLHNIKLPKSTNKPIDFDSHFDYLTNQSNYYD